jgi:hypothetical protein
MDARAEFAAELEKLNAIQVELSVMGQNDALTQEYKAAVVAEFKKRFPRSKITDFVKIAGKLGDEFEKIRGPFQVRATEAYGEAMGRRNAASKRLDELAEQAEVRSGTTELTLIEVDHGAYRSSDCGSGAYAKGSAEAALDQAEFYGINGRVELVESPGVLDPKYKHRTFVTKVLVESDLDIAILKRKPGVSLREWVRRCWKRGLQPRVYNAFLPHGYEEKNGLDYFGNELRAMEVRS